MESAFEVGDMIRRDGKVYVVLKVVGSPYDGDCSEGEKSKWVKVMMEDGQDVWVNRSFLLGYY